MRSGDIVGAVCSIEGVDAEDIGIIDIRESLTFVEILNRKGPSGSGRPSGQDHQGEKSGR